MTDRPDVCPKCGLVIARRRCVCGFEFPPGKPSRPVVGTDGKVRQLIGDAFTPRRISTARNGPSKWEKMFWAARKSPRWQPTFAGAAAYFASENYWNWPDPTWPYMPLDGDQGLDWHRLVREVAMERLVPKPEPRRLYEEVPL